MKILNYWIVLYFRSLSGDGNISPLEPTERDCNCDLNVAFLPAGCTLLVAVCRGKGQTLSGGVWGLGVHLQFTQEHSMESLHFHTPSLSSPSSCPSFTHCTVPSPLLLKCYYLRTVVSSPLTSFAFQLEMSGTLTCCIQT